MYKYFISICLFLFFVDGFAQKQKKDSLTIQKKDTIIYKKPYGIRVGIDISKPIKAQFDGSYSGFEILGDYRISKRLFVAAEIGHEKKTSAEDYTNSTTKGNYIRLGVNWNAYKNWLDMNNEIFVGYRYGFSLFDVTLNNYTPNVSSKENGNYFPATNITTPQTFSNLNAHWSELMVGLKAEAFHNFYIGFSVSYKVLMSVKDPKTFKSLYAPGFNRIFESNTGFGFNYSLTYLIPFVKK
ncbi:MAG: DUF6048 family protein [Polaribacter sp.]